MTREELAIPRSLVLVTHVGLPDHDDSEAAGELTDHALEILQRVGPEAFIRAAPDRVGAQKHTNGRSILAPRELPLHGSMHGRSGRYASGRILLGIEGQQR